MIQDGTLQSVESITSSAAAQSAATGAASGLPEMSISFMDLFNRGGYLMYPLLALSVVSIWIFAERWWAIRKASNIDKRFMDQIKQYVHGGQINYAIDLCRMTESPIARLIEKGLGRIGRPLSDVQTAVENMGNLEVAKLERGLPMLATVSGGAPMIGFLGTVVGMIRAFFDMAQAGNNIDISLLSEGIYTAMVTTVGGLAVGIIAFFGYNYLVARIENVVFKMESNTIEFMDILNEPAA